MTRQEYENLARELPYYRGRWSYYSQVLNLLPGMYSHPLKVLEVGPGRIPMVEGSHTLQVPVPASHFDGDSLPTYSWDASRTPWPIGDKTYEVGISLQVWEHLSDKQVEAFGELRRTCQSAILSLPYLWNLPHDRIHHNITDEVIARWTHHLTPSFRHVVESDPKHRRIILKYEF